MERFQEWRESRAIRSRSQRVTRHCVAVFSGIVRNVPRFATEAIVATLHCL